MSFDPATLFQAGQPGGWYDPSDLSTLWQDSAGTLPVTAAGQPVGRIADKSGNGKHLTQSASANCPTLQFDSKGNAYLSFDGVAAYLSGTLALTLPFDRISAICQTSWTLGRNILSGGSTGILYQSNASPKLRISDGLSGPMKDTLPIGVNGVVTERHIANAQQIAVNTGPYSVADAGSAAPTLLAIGGKPSGSNLSNFRLYGLLVRAGSLSGEELAGVRNWLAAKCGLNFARRAARNALWI